jgi:hypothetical protein
LWTAAILAIAIIFACLAINVFVFRNQAQTLDEVAYLFQAKIFASGNLWADPPATSADFFELAYIALTPSRW